MVLPARYTCQITFSKAPLEHFIEHGWALFPYAGIPLATRTAELIALYQEFLEQPIERLRRFTVYVNREGNREPDDGYIRKAGEQRVSGDEYDTADHKIYFHYRPDLLTLLPRDIHIRLSPLERQFIEKCHDAYLFGVISKLMLARELDRLFPQFRFYDLVASRRAMSLHVLRVLSYDPPREENATVGKRHFDRDWVTSQIFQSEEGLHLIDPISGEDISCGTRDDAIIFFCGDKMSLATGGTINFAEYQTTGKRLITGGRIPRVEHYVTGGLRGGERRRSVIFFAQTPHELPWGK